MIFSAAIILLLSVKTLAVVPGVAFDRVAFIWLENTDYEKAIDNTDFQHLVSEGITLTNYWSLAHPSQPNYMASAGGHLFGNNNDNYKSLPANVSSIVDLLEAHQISWAEYQEDMPYTGFTENEYLNQENQANDYVRKHNPLVMYDSVANQPSRLENIKNFTLFYQDWHSQNIPQWSFITPNMTNDGHDSTINVASAWSRNFITPLLENTYFSKNTLIVLTFDENETYVLKNRVATLLLGGAIPESLKGTKDDTFYTHYSMLSTVQANWDLECLGRNDVNVDGHANVFQFAADKAGYKNTAVDTDAIFNNLIQLGGYFGGEQLPAVDCDAKGVSGKGVLQSIKDTWC